MPTPKKGESRDDFMDRCMGDEKMNNQFENPQQRAAVCNSYFDEKEATAKMEDYLFSTPEGARKKSQEIGFDGEIHESTLADGTRLYSPARTEDEFIKWYRKNDPDAEEEFEVRSNFDKSDCGIDSNMGCGCGCGGEVVAYEDWGEDEETYTAAKYKGRTVTLNKPFRTQGASKKFGVYTKNEKGNVVLVRFGDPNMEIKRDDPKRRKAFRDRHNCDSPGPKWKARYWSCRQWESGRKVEAGFSHCADCETEDACAEVEQCMGTVEASDPKTPAPPKDRKKGSKKNKPGSARPGGKVTFSEAVTNSLKKKVKEHNEKSDRKVTLGMLKAVYRRGAGAYSQSHRPGVSRGAWAMARVNAFLKLVRSGKPSNPKYTTDNDLLPKGHPRKSKKAEAGCGCMSNEEEYEAAEPTPNDDETHDEYMTRCQRMGYSEDECMKAHEGHEFKEEASYHDGGSCPPGQKMQGGKCVRVAVTCESEIEVVETVIQADTGETIIQIRGIAFHEGYNKNGWEITRAGAEALLPQMIGADVTLNHPHTKGGRFTRNMDGGVDEAVVGYVTDAFMNYHNDGTWDVRYVAEVTRKELFSSLESGLWLRQGYGVSIGGTGVPDSIIEADDGSVTLSFEKDFTFDHLAIVHKPAYDRANIESVEKIEAVKYQPDSPSNTNGANNMTDEMISEEVADNSAEIEALKADLILKNAEIEAFKAAEAAKAEESRMALVNEATELGMSGHDELSTDTLTNLIASWREANPPQVEEEVVLEPVSASVNETPSAPKAEVPMVASYFNKQHREIPEDMYARAYNLWASAWNQTLTPSEKTFRAKTYEQIKEMN